MEFITQQNTAIIGTKNKNFNFFRNFLNFFYFFKIFFRSLVFLHSLNLSLHIKTKDKGYTALHHTILNNNFMGAQYLI